MSNNVLSEEVQDFTGGQDASKFPYWLGQNQYAAGVNITVQNGCPTPRWGLDMLPLVFPSTLGGIDVGNNVFVSYEDIFRGGRYQHRAAYVVGSDSYILIVIAGIIYLINIDTLVVSVISLPNNDTLNETAPRIQGENADRFYVLHDYPNFPVILDGITAFRADPAKFQVPVSVMGAYNQNRLFIANAGAQMTGGDPTGSSATPDAPITFEEVEQVGSPYFGQIFSLPTNNLNAQITAMTFLEFVDTSTGIGPLVVATPNQIFTFNTQNPRSTWETGNFGSAFVSTGGIAGPRSYVHVNSDLFYFGNDGQLRTLSMSRNEQGKWARSPISREVINWLVYHEPSLISYSVLGYFRNKIFVSVNPHYVGAYSRNRTPIFDVANGGFAVLGLNNMATLGREVPPVWEGMWTGCRPMDILTVGERCFVISKDNDFINNIYEFNPAQPYDTDDKGNIRYIESVVYTKEFDFQSAFVNKELKTVDLNLSDIKGDFSIKIDYKPSHGSRFIKWWEFKHVAPWRACKMPEGCLFNGFEGHSFRDLRTGDPQEYYCDEVSKLVYNQFRKVQLKFTLKGAGWAFKGYRANAIVVPDNNQLVTACANYFPAKLCTQCNNDWYIGPFTSCSIQQT